MPGEQGLDIRVGVRVQRNGQIDFADSLLVNGRMQTHRKWWTLVDEACLARLSGAAKLPL